MKPTLKNSSARTAEPSFEPGDRVVKINDVPIKTEIDIERALVQFSDAPITVTVQRGRIGKGGQNQ